MKYAPIPQEMFILNRRRFTQMMKPNSIAIFHSNDMMPRNGDCFFEFRQNSDLLHLCGMDQEETVLVLYPNCPKGNAFDEIIFTKKTNEHIAIWDGHKYTKKEATECSGVANVRWLDDMEGMLRELVMLADHVYLNSNENDRAVIEVPSRDERFAAEFHKKYPTHSIERAQPIMKAIRMVKSNYEIGLIQRACDITEAAFRRVMKFIKPGVWEHEVEAEIIHEFIRSGANGHAYSPIVATGANANVLHYTDNNSQLKEGELILMDFGSEYANYASDLTRTIPTSGKFSDRQKDVYNAVLRVMKEATNMLRPGTSLDDYHKEVGRIMEKELIGLGLISNEDVKNQDPNWPAYKKYFMHGTSHHLGLDVHDLCNRYTNMLPGMVFTCEPGIYIPEEGFGIRIENDIMVTDDDPIDLMKNIPIEADEIEEIMNS